MSQTRVLVLLAGAAMSIGAGTVLAGTPDQVNDTSRAYAAELKADAALRSSLLGAAEGDSSVKLGGFGQFRYLMNFRKDPGDTTEGFHDSGFTTGFEATRTRLQATGNVGSKDFTFKVEGEFAASGGAFTLADAWGAYNYGNGSSFLVGQFQLPLYKDWSISPKGQLSADMALTTAILNPGYTQGIAYQYRSDAFGILASFNDGAQSANTSYTSTSEADWGLTVRADFKGGGGWEQFDEFTSWRGNPTMWDIGIGAHAQVMGNTASTGSVDQDRFYAAAIDGMVKGNGWNGYAALIMSDTDPQTGNALVDFGLVLQGGVFVSDNVELFGRWDAVKGDKDRPEHTMFNTLTFGANMYPFVKSNAVKFTTDLQWFLENPTQNDLVNGYANGSSNVIGIRPSAEKNQIALRFQFQFMF